MWEPLSPSTRSQPVITRRREGRGGLRSILRKREWCDIGVHGPDLKEIHVTAWPIPNRDRCYEAAKPLSDAQALTWWSLFERQGKKRAISAQGSEVIDTACETSASKIVERRCQRGAAVWFEQVNKWVEGFISWSWELSAQRNCSWWSSHATKQKCSTKHKNVRATNTLNDSTQLQVPKKGKKKQWATKNKMFYE